MYVEFYKTKQGQIQFKLTWNTYAYFELAVICSNFAIYVTLNHIVIVCNIFTTI